jgi:hypothetical protein
MKFVLSPIKKPNCNYLVKQTKGAVLLVLMDGGEQVPYWVPKSQPKLGKRDVIRIIKGKPEVVDQVHEVTITDWWWSRREPAKPMGTGRWLK